MDLKTIKTELLEHITDCTKKQKQKQKQHIVHLEYIKHTFVQK